MKLGLYSEESGGLLRGKSDFTRSKVPACQKPPKTGLQAHLLMPLEFILQSKNSQAKL